MSSEMSTPEWFNENPINVQTKSASVSVPQEVLTRIASIQVNENTLCDECDIIEQCANNKSSYFYNTAWSQEYINQLHEYASAVGLKRGSMVGVSLHGETKQTVVAQSKSMVKTASTTEQTKPSLADSLKSLWGDPFKIEEKTNTDHMTKENWQQVKAPVIANEKPSMQGINVIRGGEQHDQNIDVRTAPGRNSITDPKAIETLANSKTEDTGVRLARERQERVDEKKANNRTWEDNIIKAMEHKDIMAKKDIKPTYVQGVINSTVGLKADTSTIPEQTEGEKLKSQNTERKASISRERDTDKWVPEIQQKNLSISDSFAESLKKHLNKG